MSLLRLMSFLLTVFFDWQFLSIHLFRRISSCITAQISRTCTGWVKKSTLLILSEYVNKAEKMGGILTTKNSYRENEVLSDIFM